MRDGERRQLTSATLAFSSARKAERFLYKVSGSVSIVDMVGQWSMINV
jgi:hypothetical protein